jgi:hypothetical protein
MANGRKTGGRRAGTPNKATLEIRDAARRLLKDPAYLRSVRARLLEGKAPQLEVLLHYYSYPGNLLHPSVSRRLMAA